MPGPSIDRYTPSTIHSSRPCDGVHRASTPPIVTVSCSGAEAGGMTYNSGFASMFNTAFAGGTGVGTGDAGPWISESESSAYIAHPFADGITKDRAVQRGWSWRFCSRSFPLTTALYLTRCRTV